MGGRVELMDEPIRQQLSWCAERWSHNGVSNAVQAVERLAETGATEATASRMREREGGLDITIVILFQ